MNKKKSFGENLEAFFAGKGFYIVLFLCVAVIGVSAWSMLAGKGTDVDDITGEVGNVLENEPEDSVMTGLAEYPVITDAPVVNQEEIEVSVPEAPDISVEAPVSVPEAAVENSVSASFFVWPVAGEIENGYSMAALVFNRTMQDWRTHDGVDIAADIGTQVMSAANGTVAEVYSDDLYGTTVIINHGGGLCSTYSNLAEMPVVEVGDLVAVGETIGAVGATALCETGEAAHLHFSMSLNGESADPTTYMP